MLSHRLFGTNFVASHYLFDNPRVVCLVEDPPARNVGKVEPQLEGNDSIGSFRKPRQLWGVGNLVNLLMKLDVSRVAPSNTDDAKPAVGLLGHPSLLSEQEQRLADGSDTDIHFDRDRSQPDYVSGTQLTAENLSSKEGSDVVTELLTSLKFLCFHLSNLSVHIRPEVVPVASRLRHDVTAHGGRQDLEEGLDVVIVTMGIVGGKHEKVL